MPPGRPLTPSLLAAMDTSRAPTRRSRSRSHASAMENSSLRTPGSEQDRALDNALSVLRRSSSGVVIPFSLWVIYVSAIRGPYSGWVVGVAYAAGAVTHVLLFVGYGFYKNGMIGNVGLLVYAAVIGFTPIILAAIASRFFKPELLRPIPVQWATA